MQARKLRKAEAELQAAHGAQVAAVLDKYEGLRASVQQYHAQLAQVPLLAPVTGPLFRWV